MPSPDYLAVHSHNGGKVEVSLKPGKHHSDQCGLRQGCSWDRLAAYLRRCGQLAMTETITAVEVDHNGITYTIEDR